MWEKYKHIIPHIDVCSGAIYHAADWALSTGYKSILVVCDPNTRRVAGDCVIDSLRTAGLAVSECFFNADEPSPDEYSIGFLTAAYTPDIDLILGVGSGTINDICTFVGAQVGCPSAIVGTAPSMDGYASLGSAMLLDGVKVTPQTQCPVAIFCDIDVFSDAPMFLTAAGLGDMLGKITALADWRLAFIMVGEPMPEDILSIVEDALAKITAGAPHLAERDPAVIQSVTEGLILSGIAMSLYGDSRPASGTEHHLSHFWEMRMFAEGRKPALHGIKVGLATIIGLVMWRELADTFLDNDAHKRAIHFFEKTRGRSHHTADFKDGTRERDHFQKSEPPAYTQYSNEDTVSLHTSLISAEYTKEIRRLYGRSAEAVLQTDNPNLSVEYIESKLQDILDIANSLPAPEEVAAMLAAVGAPVSPSDIGLDGDMLRDSIIYARDRKKVYTLLQLLGDLGCLEDFSGRVIRYFANNALAGVKCFVLDMDGTIYLGNRVFPYTERFLDHLRKSGLDHVFYTNNSSQNAAHYIKKLQNMGISVTQDKLLMSTHVLLEYLSGCHGDSLPEAHKEAVSFVGTEPARGYNQTSSRKGGSARGSFQERKLPSCEPPYLSQRRVFVAGTEALKDDFIAAGYTLTDDEPDFAVLGFDTDMEYERLKILCDFVRSGVPYYGVNMDYNCPVEGGFIPDCGALAAAVMASTGITPEFFGKPSRRTLDFIIQKTGYREEELCFIGDRLYTDIAIAAGTKSRSVLVLSGESKLDDLKGSEFIPDIVVDDVSELIDFLQ